MFSDATEAEFDRLAGLYPDKRSALIPMLMRAQAEHGWVKPEAVAHVAKRLDLSPSDVDSVVSFYTLLHRRPVGRNVIHVCTNLSCLLTGSDAIERTLCEKLGIRMGETTPDGGFTLIEAECLGSCTTAPVIQVNGEFHESLKPESAVAIIERLRDGKDGGQ